MNVKYFSTTTILLVLLQNAAHFLGWYNTFYSFDKIMHTLGGFWVAQAVFLLFARYNLFSFEKERFLIACILLVSVAMLLGVVWEWFEVGINYISYWHRGVILENHLVPWDTASDLLFDFIGSALAAVIFLKKRVAK